MVRYHRLFTVSVVRLTPRIIKLTILGKSPNYRSCRGLSTRATYSSFGNRLLLMSRMGFFVRMRVRRLGMFISEKEVIFEFKIRMISRELQEKSLRSEMVVLMRFRRTRLSS